MADTAFQTKYRREAIMGFERDQSILRASCVTEHEVNGNQAVFLVADSGGASASTRGVNGLIPARADNNNQYTATLVPWHDLVRKTDFNIYASQGNQRAIMQQTCQNVINRKIDDDIITELGNATLTSGAAAALTIATIAKGIAVLGNNDVPVNEEDNMFALFTMGSLAQLMQISEFASADYVEIKPFNGPIRKMRRWAGLNWMFHTGLTGAGSNDEKCYIYHRNAIGHAANAESLDTAVGYDSEQAYSYARASMFMGSKLLQTNGVYELAVNSTGYF